MEEGTADIAVHSMKDVPADMPEGFCIAAMLERANHADALVSRDAQLIHELPSSARIGSSSLRRQAQLKMLRADLVIESLRGNVNTRLKRLDKGDFDAVVLAAAGLERLGLEQRICQEFSPDEMLPAAGQGVIGIECRANDDELRGVLATLNHSETVLTTLAERAIAKTLGASCQSPLAAHAVIENGHMTVAALLAMPDGSHAVRDSIRGAPKAAANLGERLARQLLDRGAGEILEATGALHE